MLGKPVHNDLRDGVVTAPVIFAAKREPRLAPLVMRKFKGAGDVETAAKLVQSAGGLREAG